MEQNTNMTALISLFARAYHYKNNKVRVYGDNIAEKLITDAEYKSVSDNMSGGISFFDKNYSGKPEEALRYVVDNFLSATPLSRAVFFEERLKNAVKLGAEQLLFLGSGYETFPYRQPIWAEPLEIYEVDRQNVIEDKKSRLKKAGLDTPENVHYIAADFKDDNWISSLTEDFCFDRESVAFSGLLGVSQYLLPSELKNLLKSLFEILPEGSAVVFDYLNKDVGGAEKSASDKRSGLASGAGENMKSKYSYSELEKLLSECGLLIYEHMTPTEITKKYFVRYNIANAENTMEAAGDTSLCLAVKKDI